MAYTITTAQYEQIRVAGSLGLETSAEALTDAEILVMATFLHQQTGGVFSAGGEMLTGTLPHVAAEVAQAVARQIAASQPERANGLLAQAQYLRAVYGSLTPTPGDGGGDGGGGVNLLTVTELIEAHRAINDAHHVKTPANTYGNSQVAAYLAGQGIRQFDTAEIIRVVHGTPADGQHLAYDHANTRFQFVTLPSGLAIGTQAPLLASGSTGQVGSTGNAADAGHVHPVNTYSQLRSKPTLAPSDAQPNPDHVSLPFRSANAASAVPGDFVFYKSDNTEWQSGSSNDLAAVEIDREQYTLSQNPQIDDASYTDWTSFADDIVQHRGSSIWTFQRIANSSPFTSIGAPLRLEAQNIVKNDDGNYVLQNLRVLMGLDNTFGTGVNWQIIGVFAPPTGAESVVGVMPKASLPSDVVYTQQLQGHESDVYFSYTNAANEYWPGTIKFYDQSSGAPDNANLVRQPDIAAGGITVAVGTPRLDRDPNHYVAGTPYQAADFAVGDVYYLRDWNATQTGGTLTLTSAGTVVGTGNARRVWFRATLALSGTDLPDVQDHGDYWVFAKQEPTVLKVEIPATDVLGAPWLRVDGSNATEETKDAIQGDNEESTLVNTFRVDATNVDYYVSLVEPGGAQLNTATVRLPASAAGSKDDTDLQRLVKPAAWVEVGDYTIDVTSNYSRAIVGTSLTFTFNYVAVDGTKPSGSGPVSVRVVGEDVHRGQLARQAFKAETPSIAGKGGTQAQVWTRGSGDDNAGWAATATPPLAVQTQTNLSINGALKTIATGLAADDMVIVRAYETTGDRLSHIDMMRFGDVPTSGYFEGGRWVGNQGRRVQYRRSGDVLQARGQVINAANATTVWRQAATFAAVS